MKNFKAVLDILRENISFKLGVMLMAALLACFVPGLWILAVQRLLDAYGEWQLIGGAFWENAGVLTVPLVLLAVLFLAKKLDQMFKIPIEMSLRENIGNSLNVQLIRKSSRLPLAVRESAECQNKMEVCSAFIGEISQKANKVLLIFRSGIMMASMVGAASLLSPWILLALCMGTFPSFFSLVYSMNNAIKADQELGARSRVRSYYAELLIGAAYVKELKSYRLYPVLIDRWEQESSYINRKRILLEKKNAVRRLGGGIFLSCGFTISAFLLMEMIMRGSLSVGAYVAMFSAITSFSGALGDLTISVTDVMTLFERVKVYQEFMELEEKSAVQGDKAIPAVSEIGYSETGYAEMRCPDTEHSGTANLGIFYSCYRLQNVSFRYPGCREYVLKDVSFVIRKGERMAIVGENGAGKSTLVKLMLNLYSQESGEVLFCGKSIAAYGEEIVHICDYLPQDFIRYQGSLRENVLLHMQNAVVSDGQIIKALERVGLSGLLEEIGYNLDIPLGKLFEDGRELSGGQWQRLAVARGFFADTALLFLDEPNAAVDPVTEAELFCHYREGMMGKGGIIVSHRLAALQNVDRILVLEAGKIAEQGSHHELMRRKGLYYEMFLQQKNWTV